MILRAEKFTIWLRRPFRIAHGVSSLRDSILVHLEAEGFEAHGEGALPPYYPSQAETCLDWLAQLDAGALSAQLPAAPFRAAAGRVALEIALLDLQAQRLGQPLWRIWGLDATRTPPCARTISIPESEEELGGMLDEGIRAGSRHFKLKVGSGDLAWDERCVCFANARCPNARFSVDANAAWSPAEAARIIPRLAVEFVEQPVSRELESWRELRDLLGDAKIPPLVADESLQCDGDLMALRGLADGVNIKLLKAGGLDGARRWITQARAVGLKVMIGVMVETGIGRTAAAQLAPLADWLDIDPPDSIPAEPLAGYRIEGDRLILSDRPGLGLESVWTGICKV